MIAAFPSEDVTAMLEGVGVEVLFLGKKFRATLDAAISPSAVGRVTGVVARSFVIAFATAAATGLQIGSIVAMMGSDYRVWHRLGGDDGKVARAWLAKIATEDSIPPGMIADLLLNEPPTHLSWTAQGDDGLIGLAPYFAVRYSTIGSIANEGAWSAAVDLPGPWSSGETWNPNVIAGGMPKTIELTINPAPGITKWVAVRHKDDAGNVGGISNNVEWEPS